MMKGKSKPCTSKVKKAMKPKSGKKGGMKKKH